MTAPCIPTTGPALTCTAKAYFSKKVRKHSDVVYCVLSTDANIFFFRLSQDGSKMESILNICKTLFTTLVLAISSLTFIRDTERLVIKPIERMVSIINTHCRSGRTLHFDPSTPSFRKKENTGDI